MLSAEQLELVSKILSIFFPYAERRRDSMLQRNGRFAHYTSAASALDIIRTRRLWMRNATCMNDYREILHGLDAIGRWFAQETKREDFKSALNDCHAGVVEEAFGLFDHWSQNTKLQTYISSISEHDDSEDSHGRLSMWRAFGTGARVALVCKIPLAIGSNTPLHVMLSPVGYFTDHMLSQEFEVVIRKT
jgi:hypothetical protein